MPVTDGMRRRLTATLHRGFRLYQPPLVGLGWSLGLYKPTSFLFTLSFRLLPHLP